MSLNMKVFVVFHKEFFPGIYYINDKDKKYLTFYGVKEEQETTMDIIYEKDLPLYEPIWQKLQYNEASALYHIYKNGLHHNYDFIGLFQYDMKVFSNCFPLIEETFKYNCRTIFYLDFFQWAFLGGQTAITTDYSKFKGGLKNYNEFFNTNFTEEHLVAFKMPISNTFVVHVSIFEKMMKWMTQYYIEDIDTLMHDPVKGHCFNPGHMIEALTSMFLSLEVMQGAEYKKLSLHHDHDYNVSVIENQSK